MICPHCRINEMLVLKCNYVRFCRTAVTKKNNNKSVTELEIMRISYNKFQKLNNDFYKEIDQNVIYLRGHYATFCDINVYAL